MALTGILGVAEGEGTVGPAAGTGGGYAVIEAVGSLESAGRSGGECNRGGIRADVAWGLVDMNMKQAAEVATGSGWLGHVAVRRAVLLLSLVVLPVGYLAWKACCDPSVLFLPPSFSAGWATHPAQDETLLRPFVDRETGEALPGVDEAKAKQFTAAVRFRRSFELSYLPAEFELVFRTLGEASITVNGRAVTVSQPGAHWKAVSRVELAEQLQEGTNELVIEVRHPRAFPAMQVLEPAVVRTRSGWDAQAEPFDGTWVDATGPLPRVNVQDRLKEHRAWPVLRTAVQVWLAVLAGLLGWLVWCWLRQRPGRKIEQRDGRWARGLVVALVLLAALVNGYNALHMKFFRGPDNPGHAEHVHLVAREWRVPLATEGWQMYQPPAYYWTAAAAYRMAGGSTQPLARQGDMRTSEAGVLMDLYPSAEAADVDAATYATAAAQMRGFRAALIVSTAIGFGLTLIAWAMARRLFQGDAIAQCVAVGFAAFVPVQLVMNPLINCDAFAATAIGLTLWLLLRAVDAGRFGWKQGVIVGLAGGLAMLSKFNAVAIIAAVLFVLGYNWLVSTQRLRTVTMAAAFLAVVLAVSGWFYLRNVQQFGEPFVGNWSAQTGMLVHQMPTYRALSYYTSFGDVFFVPVREAMFRSWWDANHQGIWATQGIFDRDWTTVFNLLQRLSIVLGALPMLAVFVGFCRSCRSVWRQPTAGVHLLLIAAVLITLYALWLAAMGHPVAGVGTPRYFLGLVPVLGVWLAMGRRVLDAQARPMRWALDAHLVVLLGLSVLLYRFDAFLI